MKYPERYKTINLNHTKYLMFIDTETIGLIQLIGTCYPFEIGMKIIDIENDKVVVEKSYLVKRFFNNKYLMNTTFSASKYPIYLDKIKSDKRYKSYSANEIAKDISRLIKKYNIPCIVAHNGKFDYTVLGNYFQEFNVINPFEKLDVLDTMEMSKPITKSKEYVDFCISNVNITSKRTTGIESDFITNSGRVRTTAQAIYSFISHNPNFKEAHTGLEDITIEYEIFKASLQYNPIVKLNTAPSWQEYEIVLPK